MQRYDIRSGGNPSNTTFALAQFLATTGPDEYLNHLHHNNNVSFDAQNTKTVPSNKINLFERLRKKTSHANTKYIQQLQQQQQQHRHPHHQNGNSYSAWATPTTTHPPMKTPHKKYIPLIDDVNQPNLQKIQQQQQQQIHYAYEPENGPFNNTHHGGDTLPLFPTPPASSLHESLENHHPQESSSSSEASETSETHITSTTTTTNNNARNKMNATTKGSDPSSHVKNPIRGLRHMQVQTENDISITTNTSEKNNSVSRPFPMSSAITEEEPLCPEDKDRCQLCTRPFNRRYLKPCPKDRRQSCPAILASGAKIQLGHEATVLLALIEQLKQQLNEEQKSRKLLEKAIQSQWLEKN